MTKLNRMYLVLAFTLALALNLSFASHGEAQNVEIVLSARIEVDGLPYNGLAQAKAVIIDAGQTSLWSNDNTSLAASEPIASIAIDVQNGIFNLSLGSAGQTPLPGSLFDGTQSRFVALWVDAGLGFERFDNLPISTVPRAVNAQRLGGLPASDYLTTSSSISIANTNLSEPITNANLEAFSDSGDTFTIGDGTLTDDKIFEANVGNATNPALRFNTTLNLWQFSNDGVTYADLNSGTASSFVGTGSTTAAVDLDSAEVSGILPIANGGTGAINAADARTNLDLEIGVDVQAFQLNNLTAVVPPSATDDASAGYSVGSNWINTSSGEAFVAVDVTNGSAIWASTTATDTNAIVDGAVNNDKLGADSVTSDKIDDGSIVNADIALGAAIDHAKLALVGAGQVLVGNAGGVPTAVSLSGDATVDDLGAVSLAPGSVAGDTIALVGQTQGDLLYFNGAIWSRLPAGAAGTVLQSTGVGADPAWVSSLRGQAPHVVLNRRYAYSLPVATNSTSFTSVGMSNPTVTAAGTAQPALAGTARMYIRYATTAVSGNSNGITGPLTQTRPAFNPSYSTRVRTDSTIASRRIWIGITSAVLTGLSADSVGSPATTATFVAAAYDTAAAGNTTDWLCCSGDASNYSCVTTGVAVATSTEYEIVVDWSNPASLVCSVNGISVSKNSFLGGAVVNMGPYNNIRTLNAVIANHFIASQALEQN